MSKEFKKIYLDTTALRQAVIDIRSDKKDASDEDKKFFDDIDKLISRLSKPGRLGRYELEYSKFLAGLATFEEVEYFYLEDFWKRLGRWLPEAIGVGMQCHYGI